MAAADATCVITLGRVSVGAHDQAVKLLSTVAGASRAVADLSKLMAIKTAAQYAGDSISERQARDAMTRARRLLEFAEAQRRI